MQPYYAIKLKSFLIEICAAGALIIISACVGVSVLREYLYAFRDSARIAYPAAMVICSLMLICGLVLLYEAFHIDRRLFGRKTEDFENFTRDMESDACAVCKDLIVTPHYVLMFLRKLPSLCRVIRFSDIIACFENPVYGTVEDPAEYRLMIWDRRFNEHVIVMNASEYEAGHKARQMICDELSWIYQDDLDYFLNMKMTRKGRKRILDRVDRHVVDQAEQEAAERKRMSADTASQTEAPALGIKDMIKGIGSRKSKKQ